ncbi:unnamed protein product [Coregonus sp. 'balchen']|nr:unnamed protein product [Coregonus sp. 'balchen']
MNVLEHNDFINVSKEETAIGKHQCQDPKKYLSLDGNSLTTADLVRLGKGLFNIKLTCEAEGKVNEAREVIETIIKENRVVYGVNTGFGKFAHTLIPKDKLMELQANLIRSHSAGVGTPLSVERTRMLLALRINVLAKGYSGVSMETVQAMVKAFNASCLSLVPEKGTVGASGDLAPLAHLTLGLMGEGRMWSPQRGWDHAKTVLECHGLTPLVLKPKEGIGLINGTQMMSSLAAEAVERARVIGHVTVSRMYTPSAVSLQVHGVANDTIAFVKNILSTELNNATDNPSEVRPSLGALDYLAIGVHELASMSERRTERLVNPSLSELPAFLVQDGGLNSGFMIAHCTAAALVSENKALCHPSSVDSLSTTLEFLRPLKSTTPLEKVHELVRSVVRPWDRDRQMSPDIEAVHTLLRAEKARDLLHLSIIFIVPAN